MHAVSVAPAATVLSARQLHRLETANQVIKALASCRLPVFGNEGGEARLEPIPTGGFNFVQGIAGAKPVNMNAAVRGQERLWPYFRGSYAHQRLLRCLATYIEDGRSMPAGTLVGALLGNGDRHFKQAIPDFQRIIAEFRFSRVFLKPVMKEDGKIE
ncbi:hypothetical protein [Pseudomonas monteilii]|uniref:hypothetical protein n=1 Tax=Pseudomonas monteilii TaxID=76759 RepID=UPI003F6DDF02